MKIVVIYGSPNKSGCTYNMSNQIIKQFPKAEVNNIFLSDLNIPYCKGCLLCVKKGMEYCPHASLILPIKKALVDSNLIILASPVYVMHLTGQMKTFLDHTPAMFLIHRAEKSMFKKQAVVVSSAAGPVFTATEKEMKIVLNFWGISKVYSLGAAVYATSWETVNSKKKEIIQKQAKRIAKKIKNQNNKKKILPSLNVLKWFFISQMLNKKHPASLKDKNYWNENGWLKNIRPWRN